MKIQIHVSPTLITFDATPSPTDVLSAGGVELGSRVARVWCPEGLSFGSPHPDLLALASLLIFQPWTKTTLELPGVASSEAFRRACLSNLKLQILGEDPQPQRTVKKDARVGLAFSAGVDSIAALEMLPASTALFFMDRTAPTESFSNWIFNKDAPRAAIKALGSKGHPAYDVPSDLEFCRSPPGVPLDWSNGVPAVLLADATNLDAIAWGLVLESAYRVGRAQFQDWAHRPGYTRWAPIFAAAGLQMMHPVAGLSEIATSRIALTCENGAYAQSCGRSGDPRGCQECPKCFRKQLLTAALTTKSLQEFNPGRYYRSRRARRALEAYPIKHQNVIGYALEKLRLGDPALLALRDRLSASHSGFDYFERHYDPALEMIPEKYRKYVRHQIHSHIRPMNESDIERLKGWEIPALHASPEISAAQCRFLEAMES